MYAIICKSSILVKFLLSTGKVDILATAGEGGWTALHTAVDLGDANLTKMLLPTFPNIYLPPHQVLAALGQPTASSCAVTALHMAVRRNSASCAVVLLQTANALVHGHSGGWTTSEEEDDSVFVERVQQHRDFHGQVADGSRKLNKLKDMNGDTPLHWAVKTNKIEKGWWNVDLSSECPRNVVNLSKRNFVRQFPKEYQQ
ncbi:hypothetical protein ACTXT7_003530 [Hymenolepis weldensis]